MFWLIPLCWYKWFFPFTSFRYCSAMHCHYYSKTLSTCRPTISPDLSGDLRIFPILKILSKSIVFQCQTAWITVRRRVTRRLIGIQAVWKYQHSFFHSTHISQNFRICHGPVMVTLYLGQKSLNPFQTAQAGAVWTGLTVSPLADYFEHMYN